MKTALTTLLVLLAASIAQAHIEVGVHKGMTADGKECSMTAGEQTFKDAFPHPLNERIEIEVNGEKFSVGHPAVIDAANGIASFNHDLFQAVLPTRTGAKALVITMVHSQEFEGPADFTMIENQWKTGAKTVLKCTGLKFQK